MPTIIRCGGGIPVSDFEALQNEYNSYKSSHSHTNDEYNSYGNSRYAAGLSDATPVMTIASEVKINGNGTYYLSCTSGKKYIVVITSQPKQSDTSGAGSITSGCNILSQCVSSNVDLYAHTRTAVVTATDSRIGVYGYQGFAYLIAL